MNAKVMPETSSRRRGEPIRIVPYSGLQFLAFGFDIERTPRFSRAFIEHRHADQGGVDGVAPVELRPGWDDDDPEAPPPFHAEAGDTTYDISKQKALEPFLDQWTPVPLLAVNRDQLGPTNWCRVRVTAADPGQA